MSKINDLRRKAITAVRSQKWDEAVQLYERICGLDAQNASYRNELGDIFLKKGEIPSAIGAFESAADLYMAFGLTNNAIAVHKKILRHQPGSLDSLWGLGEIRRQQKLDADACSHFLDFLEHHDEVKDESRNKFLDRCSLLLDNLPGDLQILGKLESIYELWSMHEDRARVLVLKARVALWSGETDMVDKYIGRAREIHPHLATISEYNELHAMLTEGSPSEAPADSADEELAVEDPSGPAETVFELSDADFDGLDLDDETSFAFDEVEDESDDEVSLTIDDSEVEDGPTAEMEIDIDFDDDLLIDEPVNVESSETDTIAEDAATEEPPSESSSGIEENWVDELNDLELTADDTPGDDVADDEPSHETVASKDSSTDSPSAAPSPNATEETVDLLAEILNSDSGEYSDSDDRQVDSIANDVEGQIASQVADDDHKGQYEVGIIYMDMGLFEQAAEAFGRAAEAEDQRLKAFEMQGGCLGRLGRFDEAVDVLKQGLSTPGYPGRFYLGLLFEMGNCLEGLQRYEEARDYYGRVAAVDEQFLDVSERIARLQAHS